MSFASSIISVILSLMASTGSSEWSPANTTTTEELTSTETSADVKENRELTWATVDAVAIGIAVASLMSGIILVVIVFVYFKPILRRKRQQASQESYPINPLIHHKVDWRIDQNHPCPGQFTAFGDFRLSTADECYGAQVSGTGVQGESTIVASEARTRENDAGRPV